MGFLPTEASAERMPYRRIFLQTEGQSPNIEQMYIADVDLTERTTHKIILDLEEAGYISRNKVGRNNTYSIHPNVTIRDQVGDASIGELLTMLGWKRRRTQKAQESKKD